MSLIVVVLIIFLAGGGFLLIKAGAPVSGWIGLVGLILIIASIWLALTYQF